MAASLGYVLLLVGGGGGAIFPLTDFPDALQSSLPTTRPCARSSTMAAAAATTSEP